MELTFKVHMISLFLYAIWGSSRLLVLLLDESQKKAMTSRYNLWQLTTDVPEPLFLERTDG